MEYSAVRDPEGVGSSRGLPGLALFLLVGLGYAAGSLTSYAWFNAGGVGATFFPAAGVTVAALLLTPTRRWPICLLAVGCAEVTIDLAHGLDLDASLGYALANLGEATLGATLVRRFASQRPPNLSLGWDLFAFLAFAVVAGPMLGGSLGATTFIVFAGGSGWLDFAVEWLIGDGLGVLVIAAMILVGAPMLRRRSLDPLATPQALVLVAMTIGMAGAVFWLHVLPLAFAVTGLLGWVALAVGTPGVVVAGCGASLLAAQATANGHDFFADLEVTPETGLVYLQLVLAFLISGALALAAEVYERDRSVEAWARSEASRDRIDLLRRIADRMAAAATRAQVATAVAEETVGPLGSQSAILVASDARGQPLVAGVGSQVDYEAAVNRAFENNEALPIVVAFRQGEMQSFLSREDGLRRFPAVARLANPYGSVLAVPLIADGETIGVIGWGFMEEDAFDRTTVALAQAIASQGALALQRARLSEVEPHFARQMQRMMLPLTGELPRGVELATRYLPAETRDEVGGDWYDITPCDSTHLAVAIGDLVGHGVRPATAMGQLRGAASTLARDADGPAQVLIGLDRFAAAVPSAEFSTALCARYEYGSGELRYAAAGHLPPLLIADGEARVLGEGRSGPICVTDDGQRPEGSVVLPKGGLVAFYTDGLVEQRGAVIDVGIERLGEALVARAGADLERAADEVVRSLTTGRVVDDDVALVLLRIAYG
ncbi:MAG TPA: SpoIIE family protein phosphatase [Solirubrobacterales bacterium]|nr:SpoIIE family protein phosphatase [Solirubrobacterales bacterium]